MVVADTTIHHGGARPSRLSCSRSSTGDQPQREAGPPAPGSHRGFPQCVRPPLTDNEFTHLVERYNSDARPALRG
ncbi:hypothetical protein AZG88_02415 [Rhodococcus sp. LB1]|nr:hypothetical protein AZG88_02415 [Rhodococcus sp. LB1]